MDIDNTHATVIFFMRWFHILFGIIWIGHLYFFNFVNVPFQGVLEKEVKPKVNPLLLPRALWWFRWGAMMTFVFGWLMFLAKYMHGGFWMDQVTSEINQRTWWILWGATLGTIMWFNVWFVIWPAQKKLIGWMKAGQTPPEQPAVAKRALLFSRTNTYLSGPMLFAMIAPNNLPGAGLGMWAATIVVGVFTMWSFIRMSAKVGSTI